MLSSSVCLGGTSEQSSCKDLAGPFDHIHTVSHNLPPSKCRCPQRHNTLWLTIKHVGILPPPLCHPDQMTPTPSVRHGSCMILIAEKMTVALAVAVGGSCGDECHFDTATANCNPMACLAQPLGTGLHRPRQSFIMGWVTGCGSVLFAERRREKLR